MRYKLLIKKRIEQYQKTGQGRTLARISEALRIDPSYLSRFLGGNSVHFSDELIYRLLKQLDLSEGEIDFIFLLKEYDRSEYPERKKFLETKIQTYRANEWTPRLDILKKQVSDLLGMIEKIKP